MQTIDRKTMFLALAALLAVESAAMLVMSGTRLPNLYILGLTRLLEIGVLLLIVSRIGSGPAAIGLGSATLAAGIGRGLLWAGAFGICALAAGGLLAFLGHDPLPLIRTPLPQDSTGMILFFLVGGILAPVAEEVFFRGIMYGYLRQWGAPAAVIVSTMFFVAAHSFISGFPLVQLVGGLVFAVSYEVEKNLMAPVTIHVLGNLSIFTVSLLW